MAGRYFSIFLALLFAFFYDKKSAVNDQCPDEAVKEKWDDNQIPRIPLPWIQG
jgi:hypothetical protein